MSLIISLSIATLTKRNAHPDESMHLDAFQYFEGKFWPPDLGSDEVRYSAHGVSRVHSGEIIYILYGNLSYLIGKATNSKPSYVIYRLFNVLLFIITLCTLFFYKDQKDIYVPGIGFVFAAIPQIYYIYSYANSDAWSLSLSVFTFIFVLKKGSVSFFEWRIKDILILSSLTGLTIIGKKNFYISLILPYSLILYHTIKLQLNKKGFSPKAAIRILFLWLFLVLIIAAPLKIFYPWSQSKFGDYKTLREAATEEKAKEGFKPSNPSFPFKKLKQKGYTYLKMLRELPWIPRTAKSFWGSYGYFKVWNPKWIYISVFLIAVLLIATTMANLILHKSRTIFYICLLASLLVLGINLFASIRYSLFVDFQAQGRYLFPSLIALSILLIGDGDKMNNTLKLSKVISFLIVYPLCIYSLLYLCLPELC